MNCSVTGSQVEREEDHSFTQAMINNLGVQVQERESIFLLILY